MTAQHASDGSVRRRLIRRWYEDGLSETVVGGFILLIGLYWIVVDGTEGLWRAVIGSSFPVVVIFGVFASRRLVQRLKSIITYPRTGYVAFRREQRGKKLLQSAAVGAIVGATVGAATSLMQDPRFIPLIPAVALAIGFAIVAQRTSLPRLYGVSVASVAGGAASSLFPMPEDLGFTVLFTAVGFALMVGGVTALVRFLRRQPVQPDAQE